VPRSAVRSRDVRLEDGHELAGIVRVVRRSDAYLVVAKR
jgi:hypothetical protein